MKSGHYQPGEHGFAFLLARNASAVICRMGAQAESAVSVVSRAVKTSNWELFLPCCCREEQLKQSLSRWHQPGIIDTERECLVCFLAFFSCFLFCPKETHGQTQRCRSCRHADTTPPKGEPDLQLLHKIESSRPTLGKYPLRLFITKWYELWPNLSKI